MNQMKRLDDVADRIGDDAIDKCCRLEADRVEDVSVRSRIMQRVWPPTYRLIVDGVYDYVMRERGGW